VGLTIRVVHPLLYGIEIGIAIEVFIVRSGIKDKFI
jgi:hypothetical protein